MKRESVILFIIGAVILPAWFTGQAQNFDEDSLWKVKKSQLKNYTQINNLVAQSGYKYRQLDIPDDLISMLPGINGPENPTLLPSKHPTKWQKYRQGESSRLVIYLTDTTANWLGITGGLTAQGIPFKITRDIDEALKHKVVLVYPSLSSEQFGLSELKKIRNHPRNGGVLIGFNVTAPSMRSVFGFESTRYSPVRNSVIFRMIDLPETQFIREKNEIFLRIGDPDDDSQGVSSIGYDKTTYQPIAQFEDGSAAITRNLFNDGAAYCFGFDLGFLTSVAHTNLLQAQRTYINDYEPSVDVFFRLIKSIYETYEPLSFMLGSVPGGKLAPVLITHDIDCQIAVDSMLFYAEMEKRKGIQATYFLQTKYIKDGLDIAFLNEKYIPYAQALVNMGMEVGSHSVSHSPYFAHLPIGTGTERYPDYRPFFYTFTSTFNETLLGELRVSRFLLNTLLGINATSFRSGYLTVHENLYLAMQETGFVYGSNITANEVLTHMPFRPMYDFMFDEELAVYEIPITIEDELPPEMDQRLDQAIHLTHKIANYGGVVNILIHPNILGHKYRFEEAYIDYFKGLAWFGTVSDFGDWWRKRNAISVDAENLGQYIKVKLTSAEAIEGLLLHVPEGAEYVSSSPIVSNISKTDQGYLITSLPGTTELVFTY